MSSDKTLVKVYLNKICSQNGAIMGLLSMYAAPCIVSNSRHL
eukprot:Gb_41526 [translate_table: standard]